MYRIAYFADVGQFRLSILMQTGHQALDVLIHHAGRIREIGAIDRHIRLYQESVIHLQLRVEADDAGGGEKQMFFLYICSRIVMGDKATEIGDNDAIILQKQCFYVSG